MGRNLNGRTRSLMSVELALCSGRQHYIASDTPGDKLNRECDKAVSRMRGDRCSCSVSLSIVSLALACECVRPFSVTPRVFRGYSYRDGSLRHCPLRECCAREYVGYPQVMFPCVETEVASRVWRPIPRASVPLFHLRFLSLNRRRRAARTVRLKRLYSLFYPA